MLERSIDNNREENSCLSKERKRVYTHTSACMNGKITYLYYTKCIHRMGGFRSLFQYNYKQKFYSRFSYISYFRVHTLIYK